MFFAPSSSRRSNLLSGLVLATTAAALGAAGCASSDKKTAVNEAPKGPPVEVMTEQGVVRGVTERGVHVFKGIPYAAPVDGLDRWLPPKPPLKRAGVLDASSFGPACSQSVTVVPSWLLSEAGEIFIDEMSGITALADEEQSPDCLRLNLWTTTLGTPPSTEGEAPAVEAPPPVEAAAEEGRVDGGSLADDEGAALDGGMTGGDEASSGKRVAGGTDVDPGGEVANSAVPSEAEGLKAVMVFVHGGGLSLGSANNKSLEGAHLARKGVVVVNINYRIGAAGFLSGDGLFEGDLLAGNRGMMDTVAALRWIKNNIAQFGGDPENVTLFGQSGGGTNVWGVLASPSSKGLVRRAIVQSGPINMVSIDDQLKLTKAVLDDWDVEPGDGEALAKVEEDDAKGTVMQTTLTGSGDYGEMSRTLLPTTGAYGTTFMPDDVLVAVEKGRLDGIDLMVGSDEHDARSSIVAIPLPDSFAIDFMNSFIGGMIAPTDEGEEEMLKKYEAAMPGAEEQDIKERLQTDALYRVRALKAAGRHSRDSEGKTYAYEFNWRSPAAGGKLGAMHSMEIIFVYGNLESFPRALGHEDGPVNQKVKALSEAMMDAWVSFAKTGTPASFGLPEWPEYEEGERKTMLFNSTSEVKSDPDGHLRKLWGE